MMLSSGSCGTSRTRFFSADFNSVCIAVCLYVGAAFSGLLVEQSLEDLVPFIIVISLVLVLRAFCPLIVEFVPGLMFT